MRIEFAVTVLALGCLLGTPLRAADDNAGAEKRGALKEKIIEKFDANKNGKLDPDEIEKAKAARGDLAETAKKREGGGEKIREEVIKKFDKDGDGKLNEEERKAAIEAMKKRRGDAPAGGERPAIAELIKKFDKNGDGKLDDKEKAAAKASRAGAATADGARPDKAEIIKKFDKDGDGKLNDEERAAAKKAFAERIQARKKTEDN